MSYSNGKISETDPVTVTDVQTALSSQSKDVGTLCASPSVNLWAKYKPVALVGIAPLRTSAWWKGTSGKCGMDITTYTSINALFLPSQEVTTHGAGNKSPEDSQPLTGSWISKATTTLRRIP